MAARVQLRQAAATLVALDGLVAAVPEEQEGSRSQVRLNACGRHGDSSGTGAVGGRRSVGRARPAVPCRVASRQGLAAAPIRRSLRCRDLGRDAWVGRARFARDRRVLCVTRALGSRAPRCMMCASPVRSFVACVWVHVLVLVHVRIVSRMRVRSSRTSSTSHRVRSGGSETLPVHLLSHVTKASKQAPGGDPQRRLSTRAHRNVDSNMARAMR